MREIFGIFDYEANDFGKDFGNGKGAALKFEFFSLMETEHYNGMCTQ